MSDCSARSNALTPTAQTFATLVRPFDRNGSYEALSDPNRPKVVVGDDMSAVYFSRSVIPYLRNYPCEEWPSHAQYYTHVGMYAYRAVVLDSITSLPQSTLEIAESLGAVEVAPGRLLYKGWLDRVSDYRH